MTLIHSIFCQETTDNRIEKLLGSAYKNGHNCFDDLNSKIPWELLPEGWTKNTDKLTANENPAHRLKQ